MAFKPETDDNDAVLPATIKPEPADNAATEPIKIDGVELPKTQQEALTIAGRLIIEENNPTKARELLSAYGMSDAAIETFVAEAVKVQTEKGIEAIIEVLLTYSFRITPEQFWGLVEKETKGEKIYISSEELKKLYDKEKVLIN